MRYDRFVHFTIYKFLQRTFISDEKDDIFFFIPYLKEEQGIESIKHVEFNFNDAIG